MTSASLCATLGHAPEGAWGPDYAWPVDHTHGFGLAPWPGRLARLEDRADRVAEGGMRFLRKEIPPSAPHDPADPKRREGEPLISYVTVTRNAVTTLPRCLASVQAQTYPHVEHILVDGASTDGSLDIIRAHGEHLEYYVSEPDTGMYDALNKAVTLARGDYLCVLNADDWLEPDAAAIAAQCLRSAPPLTMLLTGVIRHKENGRTRYREPEVLHPGLLFLPGRWCHNTMYAARSVYEKVGLYDTGNRIASDYQWIMRCLATGIRCLYTPKATLHFSEGGMSSDDVASARERLAIQHSFFPKVETEDLALLYYCMTGSSREILPSGMEPFSTGRMDRVRDLLCRYADQPDFVLAVAWALAAVCPHPAELPVTFRKRLSRSFRAGLKRLLPGKVR